MSIKCGALNTRALLLFFELKQKVHGMSINCAFNVEFCWKKKNQSARCLFLVAVCWMLYLQPSLSILGRPFTSNSTYWSDNFKSDCAHFYFTLFRETPTKTWYLPNTKLIFFVVVLFPYYLWKWLFLFRILFLRLSSVLYLYIYLFLTFVFVVFIS